MPSKQSNAFLNFNVVIAYRSILIGSNSGQRSGLANHISAIARIVKLDNEARTVNGFRSTDVDYVVIPLLAFLTSAELEIARVFESGDFSEIPRNLLCTDQSPLHITNGSSG
jgi:hypothetical protein